jgi:hypothetical protein
MLRHHVRRRWKAWRKSGAGRQVLRWVRQGVPIEWNERGAPRPLDQGVSLDDLTPAQTEFMEKELKKSYESGMWEDAVSGRYVSKAFLVKKKGEPGSPPSWRLVIDLRWLNSHCVDRTCEYETLKMLQKWNVTEYWMVSWDLELGYACLGVEEKDMIYMTFNFNRRLIQMACIPFGWNASPWAFCTTMQVFTRRLRSPTAPIAAALKTAMKNEL